MLRGTLLLLFFCGACLLMAGSLALAQQRSFLACPIVRDTRTVPCYLAEYGGETYFLGTQQDAGSDFHAPQLKHEVLVEGTVAPGPRVCGGIPLKPVSISVMKEVNLACNTLLPAEPGLEAPAPGRLDETLSTSAPLSGKLDFTVLYSFDYSHLDRAGQRVVTEAAEYARKIGAANVKVSGYRAATLLSDGQRLTEHPGIAEKRAQDVAAVLRGLGVQSVTVEWKDDAAPADGMTDPARRRVVIAVTPR